MAKCYAKSLEEAILDNHAPKPNIQGFAQIVIVDNNLKLFIGLVALKSKVKSILHEFNKIYNLKP